MLWISIIIGIISFIGFVYSIDKTDGIAALAVLSTFGIFFSLMGIYDALCPEPITYEYPDSEYVLEYKITTIGEESDTTYVLKSKVINN